MLWQRLTRATQCPAHTSWLFSDLSLHISFRYFCATSHRAALIACFKTRFTCRQPSVQGAPVYTQNLSSSAFVASHRLHHLSYIILLEGVECWPLRNAVDAKRGL